MLGLFASMVGTLQLSRALTDRRLADAVLEQRIQNGLVLVSAAISSRRPVVERAGHPAVQGATDRIETGATGA